jgi:hypothetical protein
MKTEKDGLCSCGHHSQIHLLASALAEFAEGECERFRLDDITPGMVARSCQSTGSELCRTCGARAALVSVGWRG